MFRIYPAVDIKGGRCVRLFRGDLARETVYSGHPWKAALAWQEKGASYLHVIDLDGAAAGHPVNRDAVREILRKVSIPVQCGGGVRRREDAELLLEIGVERVILGTRALEEPSFAEEMLGAFGPRVIVSVDTRGAEVATAAWRGMAARTPAEVIDHLAACGAERIIHTDVTRDGTLSGYDTGVLEPLLGHGLGVIAAGGISGMSDLETLKSLAGRGVEGAILGRAIYAGSVDLEDALAMEET
ncbi:MAG: 1-(5-phosphoribosyl)-5-[(5-phosphoribosylamino)methylideneamino]imidazole-4-carboxamide isomerase [Actinomycetota bacterium]|nr:1-(5-phosphoribosyl)-5-[(5-phosphoribosylamino)methylideneamino]imidazole-4-carboxamide isomerase [Actinomycetota bacterium]MDD5665800.1 1-(5-phosphoribosyl)-5-[(5-phosphoribosylamino)methylideneamino]imidazole-4-carboxamide isomerase [Actinomycetota bacterium]